MRCSFSPNRQSFAAIARCVAVIALLATTGFSHALICSPNGGESFTPGQTVEIEWEVSVTHANTFGWNLEYSVNGSAGPWIAIALGLPPGNVASGAAHSYFWTTPILNSDSVRVRVTMLTLAQNYIDPSDADFGIGDTLNADVFTISIQNGGAQNLTIQAGPSFAFSFYFVVGSASGSAPGFEYSGFHIPLNDDFYLSATLQGTSLSPLLNNVGGLDSNGSAQCQVFLPPQAIPPSLAGFVLYHAGAAVDVFGILSFVTNAEPLLLVP